MRTDGYSLLDRDGKPYRSAVPGTLGGNRRSRLYGRLDCPAALRALTRGGYVAVRVFFAEEATARQAGYRPCAVCLPAAYADWKSRDQRRRDPAAKAVASRASARAPTSSPKSRSATS
jgi:methylphosphotriester-DNA--protein-cysteine methyltransferase